jgi:hypothetical protein
MRKLLFALAVTAAAVLPAHADMDSDYHNKLNQQLDMEKAVQQLDRRTDQFSNYLGALTQAQLGNVYRRLTPYIDQSHTDCNSSGHKLAFCMLLGAVQHCVHVNFGDIKESDPDMIAMCRWIDATKTTN